MQVARLSTLDVVRRVYGSEGLPGVWRGFVPRMLNVALW